MSYFNDEPLAEDAIHNIQPIKFVVI